MKRLGFVLAFALAACDNGGYNPLNNPEPTDGSGGPTGPVSETSVSTLPGTANPSAGAPIQRVEAEDGNGNGYANTFSYDAGSNTFSVNNLGFDGANAYTAGVAKTVIGPGGEFGVYESAAVYSDDVTGQPIGQFQHRAIYGISTSGQTEFAIVRTGSYTPYGFGGFMVARNGAVTLPAAGTQAVYNGSYAALRDFAGAGGLEYAEGDMTLAIDLRDFDNGNAVQGMVSNRVIYDVNGNDITQSVINNLNAEEGASLTELPAIVFTVGPGVMDRNGEIEGQVTSPFGSANGPKDYGSGKYYAILSGNNEVVGIIVTETDDRRNTGVTVRETGGFILYRP